MVKHIVVERFGKCLIESDRNNVITVLSDADIQLAIEGIMPDTVGTTGQGISTCHRLVCKNLLHLIEIFFHGDRLILKLKFLFACIEVSS